MNALVDEAGCRLAHVSADTLVLWPTKKPKSLKRSEAALRRLVYDSPPEIAAKQLCADARAGKPLFFWWD